jgi:hypothetical protein
MGTFSWSSDSQIPLLCRGPNHVYASVVTVDTFKSEIAAAQKAFEKFIVCLEKSPSEFEASLRSLMKKAIRAYESRGEGMRHGIALDGQITIILSQSDTERPLCGIYFNLHTPYQKAALPKTVKPLKEKAEDE